MPTRPNLVTILGLLGFAVCGFLVSCGGRRDESPAGALAPAARNAAHHLHVAAASDLKFALDEIIRAFHQAQNEVRVAATYGSSGNFHAQITHGAPFDMYLSADVGYVDRLIEAGLVEADSRFIYAYGRIVLWVRDHSPVDLDALGMAALTDGSVQRIAIANPAHAPYGRAAEAALRRHALSERVRERLVLGENIAQAAQFVDSGAADIGIIALSLALSPAMQGKGRMWLIPLEDHPALEQGGAILNRCARKEAAEQFRAFLLGDEGRATLARFGFILPGA